MASNNEFGKRGEQMAAEWLLENNYEILHRNWRYSHSEVDIIAKKNGVLHFMEVKARHNELYGFPEESVDSRKMKSLMRAAEEFQELFPEWTRIQYDVLSILITEQGNSITLIEDIYL